MQNSGRHDKFRIAIFSNTIVNIVKRIGSLCAFLPFYCKICMRNQLIIKIFKSVLGKSRFRPRGVNYIESVHRLWEMKPSTLISPSNLG